jgi:hypothetical protein
MGSLLLDQFSYLHFAVGVVIYFWGITLGQWFVIHSGFELLENTPTGIALINATFGNYWPGEGKKYADYPINILGDTIAAILGWLSAYYLDHLGSKYNWYDPHIPE